MKDYEQRSWIVNLISTMVILGVFAISALLLLNVGVRVYKNIALSNSENFKLRTSLSYVATKVRQSDESGLIQYVEKEGVGVLSLMEKLEDGNYETLIYYYDGSLRELYQEEGANLPLEIGTPIVEAADFRMEIDENGCITMEVENGSGDQETLRINVRTLQTLG